MSDVSQHLRDCLRRDIEKGYGPTAGLRSTREIADSLGLDIANARRALRRAAEAGMIDEYEGDGSSPVLWRAT